MPYALCLVKSHFKYNAAILCLSSLTQGDTIAA